MSSSIRFLTLFLLLLNTAFAQTGINTEWTWLKGSDVTGAYGVYGTAGVASPDNRPPKISDAVVWKASNGIIWLFGGNSDTTASIINATRDLWKYDPATNMFTYMQGDFGGAPTPGIYGTKGVASASNRPPARTEAKGWVSNSGDLYLFGGRAATGVGPYSFNDLWKYSPATGMWTWLNGSSSVNAYGTYGTGANFSPGARSMYMGGADAAGNFWLYGGAGYAQSTSGRLADLWKYTVSTNEWTFVSGSTVADVDAVFGTRGVPHPANHPGSLSYGVSWMEPSGVLWIYGGDINPGQNQNNVGYRNDLWKYEINTNMWTWMHGNHSNFSSVFGTRGVFGPNVQPRSNSGNFGWTDLNGDLWIIGGYSVNHMWKYSRSLNQWAWVKGDSTINTAGSYGPMGVSSPLNKPGWRVGHITWTDAAGNFYMLGGFGVGRNGSQGFLNDLWKISSVNLNAGISTGITSRNIKNSFLISPNPVTDNLRIKNEAFRQIRIDVYDMNGKRIATQRSGGSVMMSFHDYAPGTYLVEITDLRSGSVSSEKVIR